MFASYLPANIRTGILTAAAIFAIHEAVKLRFANLVNTLSNIYPSSFTWFTRESYMFIGSTVAIDLLIAVPMFSPDAYSWAYTLMIITHIVIFAFYVWFGIFLLNMIKDINTMIRDSLDRASTDFEQWSEDLDNYPEISSKYTNYLQGITK